MLVIGAACVAPVRAQEPPPQPNLLLQMTRPAQTPPIDSTMRDDIQARPAPPRADPLREPFRLHVGVGDPRCFPGEDGLGLDRYPIGTRRRPR